MSAQHAAKAFTDKAEGGERSYKDLTWLPLWNFARKAQAAILQDIVGNPFRPVASLPQDVGNWNNALLSCLAAAGYHERSLPSGQLNPARIGVLADALEEAGDYAHLIDHLRQQECVHVRGCWVVDLLLGKE